MDQSHRPPQSPELTHAAARARRSQVCNVDLVNERAVKKLRMWCANSTLLGV
jgi:hypothetical protein